MPDSPNKILAALSSQAKRGIYFFFALLFIFVAASVSAQTPARPKILGIAYATVSVNDICKSIEFYSELVRQSPRCTSSEDRLGGVAIVNSSQFISLSTKSPAGGNNRLLNVVFLTEDVKAISKYLRAKNIKVNDEGSAKGLYISTLDPEGHRISFMQRGVKFPKTAAATALPLHIIHAGFIVQDRAAEEHFYKDILGFRPYWHGGMKDDETTWVSLQVPDGTDWLEFMLYDPAGKDRHFLGVMNHIALGVTDIQTAKAQLLKNGAKLTEEPKLGRDGKWQLNLYDPDDTRIEFMEFKPKEKPCCSEFTGPHPGPSAAPSTPSKP